MNSDSSFPDFSSAPAPTSQRPVPKLLVSVRDSAEVLAALAGGADWIDLKEPNGGPLAAVDVRVAREAVTSLAGRRMLSAALGELRDWDASRAVELLAVEGIHVVKLGLAGCAPQNDWKQRWQAVASAAKKADKQLVAVIYADWQRALAPAPVEVISLARAAGSRFLLIDTYDKSAGSLLDHLPQSQLGKILQSAKHASLATVLAGSVNTELIGQLPSDGVTMIAVRKAVCRGERTDRVEAGLVKKFREAMAVRFSEHRPPSHALS